MPVLLQLNGDGTTRAQLIDKDGALHIGVLGEGEFIERRSVLPVSSEYTPEDFNYLKKMNKKVVLQFGPIVPKNFQYRNGSYHMEYFNALGDSYQINIKRPK